MNHTKASFLTSLQRRLRKLCRDSRCTTDHRNRRVKAWRVSGTPEAGEYSQLCYTIQRVITEMKGGAA